MTKLKSNKKKVKFENKILDEDVNQDDLRGEELGGAILNDVKIQETLTAIPKTTYDDVKLPTHFKPRSSIQYASYMVSTLDMVPRSEKAFLQFEPAMQAHPEESVLKSILSSTNGKGIHHDHPRVARAVVESLKDHPELLNLYMKNHG